MTYTDETYSKWPGESGRDEKGTGCEGRSRRSTFVNLLSAEQGGSRTAALLVTVAQVSLAIIFALSSVNPAVLAVSSSMASLASK